MRKRDRRFPNRLYPDRFEVETVDLAARSGAHRANRHIKTARDFALAHAWSARAAYFLVETLRPLVKFYLPLMLPDLLEAGTAHRARREFGLRYPLIQFVSNPWDAFHWWAVDGPDLQCVSSVRARDMLVERGVLADDVRIVSFPVDRRFLVSGRSSEAVRSDLGIRPDRPTLLFTLGAQGIGPTLSWVEEVHHRGMRCNLVCVTGKNMDARERLARLASTSFADCPRPTRFRRQHA